MKLKGILERALRQTAPAWPELREAYQWIHQAAQILENETELPQSQVQKSFQDLMESMSVQKQKVGSLTEGIEHFLKITRSYWPGLFHCYSVDGLPRTNNDATKIKTFTARDLVPLDLSAWRQKRDQMKQLRHNRLQQRRFRRQTEAYLAELETKLIQSILPP